ncbi:probable serine carboxypeptidase CPVL [Dysidea avara]|uniref:probable serine carboxypeptidase CPVL n=1 Tax=Dysidea avara TaxID=196820 RepID=UPI00331BAEE7
MIIQTPKMASGLYLIAAILCTVFTVGELTGILRKQFLPGPILYEGDADPGKPLFLTPYIKKKDYRKARDLSEVKGIHSSLHYSSHAGFFTVNETTNSNMYFWFFPAKNGDKNAPLLLWLQGGPGDSSLFALFNENGPIMIDKNGNVQPRPVNWNEDYSIMYIDNPIGAGFSFTDSDEGYSSNEDQIADNLYECLQQFFLVFDDYQKNDFYITGESYAGKFIPALAYKIHQSNPTAQLKINMKGVAIGDGFCDPINMVVGYADLMQQFSLIDSVQAEYVRKQMEAVAAETNAGNYVQAFQIFAEVISGDLLPYPSYFVNVTGCTNLWNILETSISVEFGYYGAFLEKAEVRNKIHVGNLTYSDGLTTEKILIGDVMQSVAPQLATVMENYKVLLYNGQLDVAVGGPLTERFLLVLQWSGADAFAQADRNVWKIKPDDVEVAGFVRKSNNFTQVIVRGAGHFLPYDQPERGLDMLDRFIGYKSNWEF